MNSRHRLQVSFVLATHNRRSVVSDTLARIARCGLNRRDYEIVVVDNASTDGTVEAISACTDVLIQLDHNAGSCAKSYGVERAAGRYIVFLDDDSTPRPGSVERMIQHFHEDASLGAAGFVVHLPDGRKEGSALPDVFVGCGVGFRADALAAVGGLDPSFFMQAEEYDLAFRLAGAGWRIRVFDDLHVDHLKTDQARRTQRTTYLDIRNNLRVVARYLPTPYYECYRRDWLQRYRWLASANGHQRAFARGVRAGRWRGMWERRTYRSRRLTSATLERFFRWACVDRKMSALAVSGAKRIALVDLGKNIYAFYQAAAAARLSVPAVGDDRFAAPGRLYRGIPVVPLSEALSLDVDAVVVGNSSAVHGTDTYYGIVGRAQQPVHHWFGPAERTDDTGPDGRIKCGTDSQPVFGTGLEPVPHVL
jgi:GT2 family glycosyltransferase